MVRFMRRHRDSHFTNAGVIAQIRTLFTDPPATDLQCNALPYWGGADLCPAPSEREAVAFPDKA
jgi:hypothetical protein